MLALLADIQTEGKDVVIGMLIVGLIFLGTIGIGELTKWRGHRREAQKRASRTY